MLCGRGAGITIYDIEYGWWQNHEDVSQAHGLSLRAVELVGKQHQSACICHADPRRQ